MFLSAGHSVKEPGAVSGSRKEADIAEEFRNLVSVELSNRKYPHEVDGKGAENTVLNDAIKRMRAHRVGMEFHCNAAENPKATGVEVLCAPKDNILAGRICKALADSLGIRNRGVKAENSGQHHRLGFVQAGGMIVELFFISNKSDLAAYDAKKSDAAKAVAAVIAAA